MDRDPSVTWRRFAVWSIAASLFVAVVVVVALFAWARSAEPKTPEVCRRFRLEAVEPMLGLEMATPTVEATEVGRLCAVRSASGVVDVTVNTDGIGRTVGDYRAKWAAEGKAVEAVPDVGEEAVAGDDGRLGYHLAARAGPRVVYVLVHGMSPSAPGVRQAAAHVARSGLQQSDRGAHR